MGRAFRRLTRIMRRLEREGWEIERVSPEADEIARDGSVGCTLRCRSELARRSMSITEHIEDLETDAIQIGIRKRLRSNGHSVLELDVEIQDLTVKTATRDPTDPGFSGDQPLHRDSRRLRKLYREHDTFDRMAAAAPTDVSAETIRRYMVEHGIHQPGDQPSPMEKIEDSPDLPLEEIVEIVTEAQTIYDVQQRLGLTREETRTVLSELGLLEIVMGRIQTAGEREIPREQVIQQLQRGQA